MTKSPTPLRLNHSYMVARVQELGIKQYILADQLRVSSRTVVRWMKGEVDLLSAAQIKKLSQVLHCDWQDLVNETIPGQPNLELDDMDAIPSKEAEVKFLFQDGQAGLLEILLTSARKRKLGDTVILDLYSQLSISYAQQFRLEKCRSYALLAIELGERLNQTPAVIDGLNQIAWANLYDNLLEASEQDFDQSLAKALWTKDAKRQAACLLGRGTARFYIAPGPGARADLSQAVTLFSTVDSPLELAMGQYMLGRLDSSVGRLKEAKAYYSNTLAMSQSMGYKAGMAKAWAGLSDLSLLAGDVTLAVDQATTAVGLIEDGQFVHPHIFAAAAAAFLALNKMDAAVGYLDQAKVWGNLYKPELTLMQAWAQKSGLTP